MTARPFADPAHPSNVLRPNVRCAGCGVMGCVGPYWGPWCFRCNVARIDRITASLEAIASRVPR